MREPPEGLKYISTHDGNFHCDEVLACALLLMHPTLADMPIVRSRSPEAIANAYIVVDQGGVHDADTRRFDHHQAGFSDCFAPKYEPVKLSSAGLVYTAYGGDVLAHICAEQRDVLSEDLRGQEDLLLLHNKVYEMMLLEVDAIDNGLERGGAYRIQTDLTSRLHRLLPSWKKTRDADEENACFVEAVKTAGSEFLSTVLHCLHEWLDARNIVARALAQTDGIPPKVFVLPCFCLWEEHLAELEHPDEPILYVVFPDASGKNWRVRAAPVKSGDYSCRKPLPAAWCGLNGAALATETGIEESVFVHRNGFMGATTTRGSALAMAEAAARA